MVLRLFDTLKERTQAFSPPPDAPVRIYVCGPTVYAPSHVGHARNYLLFDGLRRFLESSGHRVRLVENITDFEEKISRRARELGLPWRVLARREERDFLHLMDRIRVRPSEHQPRSSDFVPEMVRLIRWLERRQMAYRRGGSVYLRARAVGGGENFPAAELLSDHSVRDAAGSDLPEADDPLDFALWKPPEPGGPVWSSPWGRGVPGWHIECFVMAQRYLRTPVDLHGGGLDLIFPHHYAENLLSYAVTGRVFSRRFVHGGFVTMGEVKMSKSLGNLVPLSQALEELSPEGLRWYLWTGAPYREKLEYDPRRAQQAQRRFEEVRQRITPLGRAGDGDVPARSLERLLGKVRARIGSELDFGGALEGLTEGAEELAGTGRPGIRRGEAPRARKALLGLSELTGIPWLGPTRAAGKGRASRGS